MLVNKSLSYTESNLYPGCTPLRGPLLQHSKSCSESNDSTRKFPETPQSVITGSNMFLPMDCLTSLVTDSVPMDCLTSLVTDSVPMDCSVILKHDTIDHPNAHKIEALNTRQNKLLESMKYEYNRLKSFRDKWPLSYVKPEELAEAGLFYLQTEDKVQCAFCCVIISNWVLGDKPLKEHVRSSSLCKFLLGESVGNIPIKSCNSWSWMSKNVLPEKLTSTRNSNAALSYKPKHPKMADLKTRLHTYRDWPLTMLKPAELSACGLYYTGVSDVVTCYFCGGSLANWELEDDPWTEHSKFFPNCVLVKLPKPKMLAPTTAGRNMPKDTAALQNGITAKSNPASSYRQHSSNSNINVEALDIFPKSVVENVVAEHLRTTGRNFLSLEELCEEILEQKPREHTAKIEPRPVLSSPQVSSSIKVPIQETNSSKSKREIFLCKICMDEEMGIVFQPCGHLVSCTRCAHLITECPLCRKHINDRVRTYLS